MSLPTANDLTMRNMAVCGWYKNRQAQAALVQLLQTPQQPTPAMVDLMALPDLPSRAESGKPA